MSVTRRDCSDFREFRGGSYQEV
ncbi:hypothetical protein Prudu_007938 [Prunus dulcis]|uniref:Uncharacterized protein n=1 Tax=Prunus dulcis TaxID=3755 RepID=A0A4Y1R319_PRUDU|nr:hypothetical protein Prudu_007938 [Prunus dulcis]